MRYPRATLRFIYGTTLALIFMACSSPIRAQQTGAPSSEDAVNLLLRANEVDDSAVGVAAARTPEYRAFSQLYAGGSSSLDATAHLLKAPSSAARVYGYLILVHIAPNEADAAGREMLKDQTRVVVRSGCVGLPYTVAEVAARIQKRDRVIALPK